MSVVDGSHREDIPFTSEFRHGRNKPACRAEDIAKFEFNILPLEVGQAVVFNPELLHKGVNHDEDITRVSIEFAVKYS